jgi:hypothetical protein
MTAIESTLGGSRCRQRAVHAPIVFGIWHGPVDAVVVSHTGKPGEGLATVVSSAKRIHVGCRCDTAGNGFVMIKIAAVGRYGVGGESAGSGTNLDRLG